MRQVNWPQSLAEVSPLPKLAANLSMMFNEVPFLDRFEAAASAGFKAVEFLFPYEHPAGEIRARLDRHGLRQALFNAPPGDWAKGERGTAIFPERREEFRAGIEKALGYAKALGCPKLHVMAGVLPAGADRPRAEDCYVENLKHAASLAKAAGVLILIEPLNPRDMPGFFLMSLPEGQRIIERTGSDNIKLQLDLYHRQITGGDLTRTIEHYLPLSGHVQIADVPGRHEPGTGEINFPPLFELLDRLGYDGYVGCEYRPKAGTVEGLGWAANYGITGKR